ncbi:MAG: hypothetical protein HZB70_00415 [Candidatus Berkelbacteria bacterium]|nr:MAG: hypothetical protein HZB70_00415 [Candidatus Berkelbacteria bacterium]QQG51430.1 MAG: hypothetical protein HY845_02585 [Candidatus Berkelbacteria bacterium]
MTGTTTIIATGEATPRPAEMVCNLEVMDILAENGVEIPPKRRENYDKDFHGIKSRWLTPPCVSSYDLALEAGINAFRQAANVDPDFSPSKVMAVHSGGSSPHSLYSGVSNKLQYSLFVPPCFAEARDDSLACTSAVDALLLLDSRLRHLAVMEEIEEPIYGCVVIGEAIGTVSNQPDSTNYILWGCGGSALVVKHDPRDGRKVGIRRSRNISDGQFAHWFEAVGIGTDPRYLGVRPNATMGEKGMYGREVQEYIMDVIAPYCAEFVAKCGVDPASSTSHLCGHNPTYDGAKSFGIKAGFAYERIHSVADDRANTSSTSPFLNYHTARTLGLIKRGDNVFLVGYGAGPSAAFLYYIEP